MEHNRNYLSDSFGDFLFNNDEYLWMRLAITLDPAASEPARFKNKRIQASGDMMREESEPEVVPISPSSSTKPSSTITKPSSTTKSSSKPHPFSLQALKMNQLARIAAREAERKREADFEDE